VKFECIHSEHFREGGGLLLEELPISTAKNA